MPAKQSNQRKIRLELPKEPSAIYANTVMITHTASEVLFDFIQVMPNDDRARMQKRIMMTPTHAKMLMGALQENIKKFEAKHGEISAPQRQSLADQLFGTVKPEQDDETDE